MTDVLIGQRSSTTTAARPEMSADAFLRRAAAEAVQIGQDSVEPEGDAAAIRAAVEQKAAEILAKLVDGELDRAQSMAKRSARLAKSLTRSIVKAEAAVAKAASLARAFPNDGRLEERRRSRARALAKLRRELGQAAQAAAEWPVWRTQLEHVAAAKSEAILADLMPQPPTRPDGRPERPTIFVGPSLAGPPAVGE